MRYANTVTCQPSPVTRHLSTVLPKIVLPLIVLRIMVLSIDRLAYKLIIVELKIR